MKITENVKICWHCGILTDKNRCDNCGSGNSLIPLKNFLLNINKIPIRLYKMNIQPLNNYIHIQNAYFCQDCYEIFKEKYDECPFCGGKIEKI